MRISKKTRDEAILICAIAASNKDVSQDYVGVCVEIGEEQDGPASDLAIAAWEVCQYSWRDSNPDAEAECLLRDGWSPGDPVEEL